jgi:3-oxoadipate enol-lactonase
MRVRIDRGGFHLEADQSGAGRGAPVILLSNSLGTDHTMWQPQLDLLGSKYTVLRYDTRGHGASDTPPGPYTFDGLVADAVAVLDHFGVEKADYMGLSLGGMTGLGVALTHPDRIGRLICCDARADAPEGFIKSWDDRVAAIRAKGIETLWAPTSERWFTQAWRDQNPEDLETVRRMFLRTTADGYAGCAAALKTLDYRKSLGRLSMPVLFVCGDVDTGSPPDVMRQMAAETPGAEFALIKNAAHIANMDNAAGFNAAVARFLGIA